MPGIIIPNQRPVDNSGADVLLKTISTIDDFRKTNAVVDKADQEKQDLNNNVMPQTIESGMREKGFRFVPVNADTEVPIGAKVTNIRQNDGTLMPHMVLNPPDVKKMEHTGVNGDVAFDPSTGFSYDRAGNRILAQSPDKEKTDKSDTNTKAALTAIDSARGNAAYQQAEKDSYSIGKVFSIIKQAPGGDLNQLTPTQKESIDIELAKIKSGGSPTEAEMSKMDINSGAYRWAKLKQTILNQPEAANAGEFIAQNRNYLLALGKDANDYISSRNEEILNNYKPLLSPDNFNNIKANSIDKYKNLSKEFDSQLASLGVGKAKTPGGLETTATAASSAQAPHRIPGTTIQLPDGRRATVNADGKTATPIGQ